MLSTAVVIVLSLAWTTNLVLSCPPSSNITEVQDIKLCNGSLLSIKLNVSDSCNDILGKVHPYIYQYTSSGGTERSPVSWKYSHYSDALCGMTARLSNPLIINVNEFYRTNLFQIRLRELGSSSETCSNNFYVFLDYTGFLGPPVNINSYSYNCSNINVTWSDPDYQCGIKPVYYNLSIYDAINGSLVDTVSVYDTSYQFVDNNLFIHRYTYVITGVNELGEGISNNDTFSYQRVLRLAVEHRLEISNYTQDIAIVQYHALVTLECTDETPGNIRVIIQCTGTGVVYNKIYLSEYSNQSINVTGFVPVTLNQQCTITIVFNNSDGSSEPFLIGFNTTLPSYTSSSFPTVPVVPTLSSTLIITTLLLFGVSASLTILIAVTLLSFMLYLWRKKIKSHNDYKVSQEQSTEEVEIELVRNVISTAPMPSIDMGDSIAMQPTPEGSNSDNHEAANDSTTCRIFTETETTVVKTETNKEQGDIETLMLYDIIAEEQKEFINTKETMTTEAIEGGAAKEKICLDLNVALSSSFIASPKTEYTEIESVRPKLKVLPVLPYDDVIVTATSTTVIGATGGDPSPLPDKKSKGVTTTGQNDTNGETDPAQDSFNNDHDTVIDETQARTPSDITLVTGIEGLAIIVKGPVQQTNPSTDSSSMNFLIPRRLLMPERSFLSTAAVTMDSKPPTKNNEDKEVT